jgi:hypothetical protein
VRIVKFCYILDCASFPHIDVVGAPCILNSRSGWICGQFHYLAAISRDRFSRGLCSNLIAVGKRQISAPCRESIPDFPLVKPVAWSLHWLNFQLGSCRQSPCQGISYRSYPKLTHLESLTGDVRGTPWRSWLRHCATNRKVAGSIPDGVTGTFQ